jgi:hypothetical protein
MCRRLGMTQQGARRLLSKHSRSETATRIVACCLCGGLIVRGEDVLRNNGPAA